MPKKNAEYQREHRERRAQRLAELESENAGLRWDLEAARQELAAALAECERLSARACQHPAGAVDEGTCHACGADVW